MKHTPLPWKVSKHPMSPHQILAPWNMKGKDEMVGIADISAPDFRVDEANAAYIVQACNSFPDLVEVLKLFEDLCPRVSDDDPISPALSDAVRQTRDALKKAGVS